MAIASMSDEELIELWDQIASKIDPDDTEKPSIGTRRLAFLGEIHDELIIRGYKAQDGSWVKANGAKSS